jgi:hypothetical protein
LQQQSYYNAETSPSKADDNVLQPWNLQFYNAETNKECRKHELIALHKPLMVAAVRIRETLLVFWNAFICGIHLGRFLLKTF